MTSFSLQMSWFYELYPDAIRNLPQVGVDSLEEQNFPQLEVKTGCGIFNIPWGHNKLIIDKCKGDPSKANFFVKETLKNNWSRAVLMNFLDTDLYNRQGKAISNFDRVLPSLQSDLAQEMTKALGSQGPRQVLCSKSHRWNSFNGSPGTHEVNTEY